MSMLNDKEFHQQGEGGYYQERELGITIRYSWDEEAKLFTAVSSDACGMSTVAHSRDAVVIAFIKKYNSTWTQRRINILKSKVRLTFDDRNQELTKEILEALTDLNELSMKTQFDQEVKNTFTSDFGKRKQVDYRTCTLFLISVAAATYIVDTIRSLFR